MAKQYEHLTLAERDVITTLLAENKSLRTIAQALGRSPSSISRELKRNASPEYRLYLSHRAHGRAQQRRKQASQRLAQLFLAKSLGQEVVIDSALMVKAVCMIVAIENYRKSYRVQS